MKQAYAVVNIFTAKYTTATVHDTRCPSRMFLPENILTANHTAGCDNKKQCIWLFSHMSLYWPVMCVLSPKWCVVH